MQPSKPDGEQSSQGGGPPRKRPFPKAGELSSTENSWGGPPHTLHYNHCLLAVYPLGDMEKVLMFLAQCSEENFTKIIDHLHDEGYQLSRLRKETFIHYFNNIQTNSNCFLIQDDEDFEKAFEVIRRAA